MSQDATTGHALPDATAQANPIASVAKEDQRENTGAVLAGLLSFAQAAKPMQRALNTDQKNAFLLAMAKALNEQANTILVANQQDCLAAETQADLPAATRQRLKLTPQKWATVIEGLRQLATLPDPVGQLKRHTLLDDGLDLQQTTVPLGVLAIIFEARPDVLPQIAGLTIKSGNVAIVKGGQESTHTNRAIMAVLQHVTEKHQPFVAPHWLQLVEGRAIVGELLKQHHAIDLVIPRGSNDLVQWVMANTRIPVLGHADGICHLYWHVSANPQKALATIIDAKSHYPAACNALETLLIDKQLAPVQLPLLHTACQQAGITLLGCPATLKLLQLKLSHLNLLPIAPVTNWATEYGTATLAVKLVDGPAEAMAHIATYGSHHTDGILAEDAGVITQFLNGVDSASVYVNASTRFADGYRYGLGAEVGISTSRTHARGPVGLEGLISTQWVLKGQYHTVAPYADGSQQFKHIQV
jgi:glutamate-5-semialdehyde dehydrogenase